MVKTLEDGSSQVVMPATQELTTQQAAELLGVSRPHIIGLLDDGKIPFRLVGKHRRIPLREVIAFASEMALVQRSMLDQMAKEAFDSGMYDLDYSDIIKNGTRG